MADEDGEKYEVTPRDYIEFDITKANYSPLLSTSMFFRRGPGGVLEPAYLVADRLRNLAGALCRLLLQGDQELTKRDLVRGPAGKDIAQEMGEQIPNFVRSKDMAQTVDFALQEGMAQEVKEATSTRPRLVIRPVTATL